jgi:hypothetical protein
VSFPFIADRIFVIIMHILLCRQAILVGDSACKLASIFVQSYYYLVVIHVLVITNVWLLLCCSYPWPWLLEPARCVMEPRAPVLAAFWLPARLPQPWMRPWSLPLVSCTDGVVVGRWWYFLPARRHLFLQSRCTDHVAFFWYAYHG